MDSFSIGGIIVAVLVFGIVEAAKEFGLTNTKVIRGLALGLAVFFVTLAQVVPMLPETTQLVITIAVTSLAAALSAMGYYDYAKKRGR
jgi:hypothetical protein